MDRIRLIEDSDMWQAFVNTVMILGILHWAALS
jgi:hypothetical protein